MHLFLALSLCVSLVIAVPVSVSNIYNKKKQCFISFCACLHYQLYTSLPW